MARKRVATLSPAPVMVVYFQGGEHVRMSFWQPKRDPWRFAPVVAGIRQIIGNERGRAAVLADPSDPARRYAIGLRVKLGAVPGFRAVDLRQRDLCEAVFPVADDVLAYHVEWQGEVYRDQPASVGRKAKPAPRSAARAVARRAA